MPSTSGGKQRIPGSRFSISADDDFPTLNKSISKKRKPQDDFISQSYFVKSKRIEDVLAGPRFVVMKRKEFDTSLTMLKVSPIIINKAVEATVGEVKNIKRTKDESILIETFSKQQADKLYKLNSLYKQFNVEITDHPFLNSCKGVISCEDFIYMTEDEIVQGLEMYHVTTIRKITKRDQRTKEIKPTSTIIATFGINQLPQKVKFGFLSLNVRTFIPNPLRCFTCQRYGHGATRCTNPPICGICSYTKHDPDQCKNGAQCFNCTGEHPSWSRQCPVFIQEHEIQKIKTVSRLSYFEAKKEFKLLNPLAITYRTNNTTTSNFTSINDSHTNSQNNTDRINYNTTNNTTKQIYKSNNKINSINNVEIAHQNITEKKEQTITSTNVNQSEKFNSMLNNTNTVLNLQNIETDTVAIVHNTTNLNSSNSSKFCIEQSLETFNPEKLTIARNLNNCDLTEDKI